jgi:hypothetical protein
MPTRSIQAIAGRHSFSSASEIPAISNHDRRRAVLRRRLPPALVHLTVS